MTMRAVATATEKVRAHVEDGVGWLVFDDPDRHNTLTAAMHDAIPPILDAFQSDPEVAVIVVAGAGGKAFVAGVDVAELGRRLSTSEARVANAERTARFAAAWRAVEKPVIAMIGGYCLGGGLLLAMKADIRIASDDSQFAIPAARLGVGYPYANVVPLVELVGPAWASEILFSGRRIGGEEASRIGLVNRSVPAEQLDREVRQLAATIVGNAPLTVRACKAAVRASVAANPDLALVDELVEGCFRSDDFTEGQRAFLEKRSPSFRGR